MQRTLESSDFVDDDNWSRQVQTDGSDRGLPSTFHSLDAIDVTDNDDDNWSRQVETDELVEDGFVPQREEPTLKEKLVERERQRRVETERARLKRQFALRQDTLEDGGETGSVAGTVGEGSIVAPVDALSDDEKLTYPMERFLQEQGTILEEEIEASSKQRDTQGVVMERFLQEPVVLLQVEPTTDSSSIINHHPTSTVEESTSFYMDLPTIPDSPPVQVPRSTSSVAGDSIPEVTTPPRSRDYNDTPASRDTQIEETNFLANASMDCILSEESRLSDLGVPETPVHDRHASLLPDSPRLVMPPESPMLDQPRVLGLTQAEIEELAAIEEVSQQNAPPSERDDLSASSFVGELVSDFGGPLIDHNGHGITTLSQGTTTTAMESVSIFSGVQSAHRTVSEVADDQHSVEDALGTASVSSNILSAGGSVTANPPSEVGHEDALLSPLLHHPDNSVNEPVHTHRRDETDDLSDLATLNAGVVNRRIRPGMVATPEVRRSLSVPDNMVFNLDGFDYDKDAPPSPAFGLRNLIASDLWSPGSKMSVDRPSPYSPHLQPRMQTPSDYEGNSPKKPCSDTTPLMPDIPSEIITKGNPSTTTTDSKVHSHHPMMQTESSEAQAQAFTQYLQSSALQRAFPGRSQALAATLLIELPVLLMVTSRGHSLCTLLGQSTFSLWIGLLLVGSAVSGNVSLQASSLTLRGMTTGQVTWQNFKPWMLQELETTIYIGLSIAGILGLVAVAFSGGKIWFGVTIIVAQFCSILLAAITGTLTPFLVASTFPSRAPYWIGLVETALPDLFSTLAMMLLSFKLLEYHGGYTMDPTDVCVVPTTSL